MKINLAGVYKAGVVTIAVVESAFCLFAVKTGFLEKFSKRYFKDETFDNRIARLRGMPMPDLAMKIAGESALWPVAIGAAIAESRDKVSKNINKVAEDDEETEEEFEDDEV